MSLEFHPVPPNYEARKAAGRHTWWVSPYAPIGLKPRLAALVVAFPSLKAIEKSLVEESPGW